MARIPRISNLRGYPPARFSPPMATGSDFESILCVFRCPSETPLRPHGDQFSASTRPGRAKESKKDTQSSDHVEGRVPDDLPQGIAVVPDLHFMLKMQ